MQFIRNGPDIPDALLQAHEEGRAVFFCGAGISYPAGLPGFKGLVNEIYLRLGTTRTPIEDEAYGRDQFDITLDLLERRIPGQRIAVRKALAEALKPKLRRRGATETHTALLQLALSRERTLRLVTTNFDRVFEHAARRSKQSYQSYQSYAAPTLPIPKASRWNGLIYLHGLLPSKPDDESALNRLVVTSGDFGLAYLTERWASRFVSELFRNYVVCFVGYGINDPVLRYMMDALAADRMLGEETPQAYALGACEPGQETIQSNAWKSKGVLPILYKLRSGKKPHSALHQTLKVWAETHRDGINGKERIVAQHALARPSASTRQDDFVGRMLWALSDKSGLPAKRFAGFVPAPSLEWLKAFSENRFQHDDLSRFDISLRPPIDDNLRFSLIRRPAPYKLAPWMTLCRNRYGTDWDDVMLFIACWLARHLNDPQLIHWVLENGGVLHDRFAKLIEFELDRHDRLHLEGKIKELDKIRASSPQAIPEDQMRVIWRLWLRGRVKSKSFQSGYNFDRWMKSLKREGLSASLRMELRENLSPMIVLRKPFHWPDDEIEESDSSESLRRIVDGQLELAADHVYPTLYKKRSEHWNEEYWQHALSELLDDFQQLLLDALSIHRELGVADDRSDGSFVVLPSIIPHWQNRRSRDWVVLIELLRDALLTILRRDPARAALIAERWFELPYPTFKRLAFFAASKGCIDSSRWSGWLLSDDCWWLWSLETHREVMRLLVLQGHRLSTCQGPIEAAILDGPPRHMYQVNLESGRWEEILEREVWLLLAKLDASGLELGEDARSRFDTLSSANPSWELLPYEREEFSCWMSGTGDPDYEENRRIDFAPRKRQDLVQWLRFPPRQERPFYQDNWADMCGTRFFHCLFALRDLAEEGFWPVGRWREALQVWSEEGHVQRSWRYAAPLVRTLPDHILQEISHGVAWWLKVTSRSIERHEDILLELSQRIMNLPPKPEPVLMQDDETVQRPVTAAINHPVGLVAEALLSLWLGSEPNDGDRLPANIQPLFSQICDTQEQRLRHGRVLLASRLIFLFRVDPSWTTGHLLPLFSWTENPVEARLVWEGFLWSPRLYWPLFHAFRSQFLETAGHYHCLGEHGEQYVAVLTYAALEPMDGEDPFDFQAAFEALPIEGLQEAASTLSRALESSGSQRGLYWTNRILPFWQDVWPKSSDRISGDVSEALALMIIAAEEKFPDALDLIHGWLRTVEYPDTIVFRLQESDLSASFPTQALRLLDVVVREPPWVPSELGQCLTDISRANPELVNDHRYQRLLALVAMFE